MRYQNKYGYHRIIKGLAEEFEGQFKCLGQSTEKYITFSVQIKKKKLKMVKQISTN